MPFSTRSIPQRGSQRRNEVEIPLFRELGQCVVANNNNNNNTTKQPPTTGSPAAAKFRWAMTALLADSQKGSKTRKATTANIYPGMLSDSERTFILSVERGDQAGARRVLVEHLKDATFNKNCVDPLGRNALLIAIENENLDMLNLVLEYNIETVDALLYAINEENVVIVETLLKHLDNMGKFDAEMQVYKDRYIDRAEGELNDFEMRFWMDYETWLKSQGVEYSEHSAFTPDITPIVLAAHRDNYEIINLLHLRRAAIQHPHDVRCACQKCLDSQAEDSLRFSRSRINTYRALSSPSLICICQRDPILYAFELSDELRRLSRVENEFRTDYQELAQKCQKFAVDLLDQTRGSAELEVILNHDNSDRIVSGGQRAASDSERMELHRLKMAIHLRQKRFVAHPNCQQLLASMWYEGLPGFRRKNIVFKFFLVALVILSYPFLCLFYIVAPKSVFGQFLRKPFIKFLVHSASYCTFLVLLILASQRINYDELFGYATANDQAHHDSEKQVQMRLERKERRGPPPTPVEWAIIAWVFGLIWVEIKQLWNHGIYEYCHNMWNILDFITNSLYLATITLRVIAYIQVEAEISHGYSELGRQLKRARWDKADPTLVSECIFATANIFSSLKLVHIFTVNPHLGPLQISLGRMVTDIMKFFTVYCLVLFSFACGLNQLYWYYATVRNKECETFIKFKILGTNNLSTLTEEYQNLYKPCDQRRAESFANLYFSIETLFWSIFGLIDLDHFNLKEPHTITEWVGKTMFGTYGIISIVVLLNMLIAMMSNSYQIISNQSDVEWKFARSRLWIGYFEEGATLPPPLSIVPTPKTFYYAARAIMHRFCKCSKVVQQSKQRSVRLQKILRAVSDREKTYKRVMDNLVKRYIAFIQRQKQNSVGVSEDDVNEIKQDISAFRFEMLEIFKRNDFDTGDRNVELPMGRNKRKNAAAERRLMKRFDPIAEDTPNTLTTSSARRTSVRSIDFDPGGPPRSAFLGTSTIGRLAHRLSKRIKKQQTVPEKRSGMMQRGKMSSIDLPSGRTHLSALRRDSTISHLSACILPFHPETPLDETRTIDETRPLDETQRSVSSFQVPQAETAHLIEDRDSFNNRGTLHNREGQCSTGHNKETHNRDLSEGHNRELSEGHNNRALLLEDTSINSASLMLSSSPPCNPTTPPSYRVLPFSETPHVDITL